jgi:hypothetical protein
MRKINANESTAFARPVVIMKAAKLNLISSRLNLIGKKRRFLIESLPYHWSLRYIVKRQNYLNELNS